MILVSIEDLDDVALGRRIQELPNIRAGSRTTLPAMIGSLTVTMVFLFHTSACATGEKATPMAPTPQAMRPVANSKFFKRFTKYLH